MVKQPFNQQQSIVSKQLLDLYDRVKSKSERLAIHFPLNDNQYSRDNLIAYLSFRKQSFQNIQHYLIYMGTPSLNQIDRHVLYSLEKLLRILNVNPLQSTTLSIPTPSFVRNLSHLRSSNLFGKSQIEGQSRIMVTLDAKMVHQQELMEQLLLNGMSIARINCAHDQEDVWKSLIDVLRKAEEKLGRHKDQTCKIYMDLAGPKIRTGKIIEETTPLKIAVPTDPYGRITRKTTGYIDSSATHSMLTTEGSDSFILAVKTDLPLDELKVNDELTFIDTRSRKRKLKVVECISQICVKVELNKTAYVDENTIIHHQLLKLKIRSLPTKPADIFVRKGDFLRLYLNSKQLGHTSSKEGPAGIPVTLSKAFRNIRLLDRVFIDDGKIHGIVKDITNQYVEIEILSPTDKHVKVKEEKGLNMPDSLISLNVPALTAKDIHDLSFVTKHADIIGISFVHSPHDLITVQEELQKHSAQHIPIVAKIETKDAVHQLAKIIIEGLKFKSFGIMIARGDLAIEAGFENLHAVQEDILAICSAAHVPVILATGVLDQLTKKGTPTRAEMIDAAYGKQADCVMLNKGPYIIESVKMLSHLLNTNSDYSVKNQTNTAYRIEQYGFC